jgi:hypothetical protein
MKGRQFEFVDESEEPRAPGGVPRGGLTGWESVVFLVGDSEEEASAPPAGLGEEPP